MFQAYHHPWFILYSFVILGSIFLVQMLGGAILLLGIIAIILVDFQLWPESKCWMEINNFKLKNRLTIGCVYAFICLFYVLNGLNGWLYYILIIGFLMFLLERQVAKSN